MIIKFFIEFANIYIFAFTKNLIVGCFNLKYNI